MRLLRLPSSSRGIWLGFFLFWLTAKLIDVQSIKNNGCVLHYLSTRYALDLLSLLPSL